MLTIDEAISREKQLAEVWSEEHEQIAKWLEELKTLKDNSISKEAFEKMKSKAHNHGYRQGYSKAIDDFEDKAIDIVYEENNIDINQQPRNTLVDIHCKLMDLAKLLKETINDK